MTPQTIKKAIAAKIIARLEELGIRRTEFADMMATSHGHVTRWLKGDHNFTVDTLIKIEKTLKIKLLDLDYTVDPVMKYMNAR